LQVRRLLAAQSAVASSAPTAATSQPSLAPQARPAAGVISSSLRSSSPAAYGSKAPGAAAAIPDARSR
jgi:hypothetical protein